MSAIAICVISGLLYQGLQAVWNKETFGGFQHKKTSHVSKKEELKQV